MVSLRYGGSPDDWSRKPYVWVLWCYAQIRQHDRIAEWVARMQRWEAAYLMAKAMNEPEKFVHEERDRILDEAREKAPLLDAEWDEGARAFDEAFASGRLKPGHTMKVH